MNDDTTQPSGATADTNPVYEAPAGTVATDAQPTPATHGIIAGIEAKLHEIEQLPAESLAWLKAELAKLRDRL